MQQPKCNMLECVGSLISTFLPISIWIDGNLENTEHYLVYVFITQKHFSENDHQAIDCFTL